MPSKEAPQSKPNLLGGSKEFTRCLALVSYWELHIDGYPAELGLWHGFKACQICEVAACQKHRETERETTRPKMVKATNVAKKNNYNYNQSYNKYSYNKRNYNNDNFNYDLMATIAEAY